MRNRGFLNFGPCAANHVDCEEKGPTLNRSGIRVAQRPCASIIPWLLKSAPLSRTETAKSWDWCTCRYTTVHDMSNVTAEDSTPLAIWVLRESSQTSLLKRCTTVRWLNWACLKSGQWKEYKDASHLQILSDKLAWLKKRGSSHWKGRKAMGMGNAEGS